MYNRKGLIATALIVPAAAFAVYQAWLVYNTRKTESQPYKVIRKEKDFEIRLYPSVTMAGYTASAKSFEKISKEGFKRLAGYIFGGNESKTNLAMTSPVHIEMKNSEASMSFVLPARYNLSNVPLPNDTSIQINTSPDEYVAALEFGGFACEEKINRKIAQLKDALTAHSISHYGNFRYLGYNPPHQLVDRRNEIIVSITPG